MPTYDSGFVPGTTVPSTTTPKTTTGEATSPPIAVINPFDSPEAWDKFILAGRQSPGLCTECAGSNPRKWDKRDGTAQSGATVVYSGDGLASFSAKIQLGWGIEGRTPQQEWEDWYAFKELLKPPSEKNPQALDIYHPNLEALPVPIHAVVVADDGVIGPKQVADGVWEIELKFMQYRPAKPAGAKASGSKSNGAKTGGDPIDGMINYLKNQVDKLA
jgi:hypothetical protein